MISDELRAFLDAISDHYLYPLYRLAATTGMHRAELAGLVWRNVDSDTARLTVSQQLLSVEYKLIESGPKTPTSRRTIDLDSHTGLPWNLRHVDLRDLELSDSDAAATNSKCFLFERDLGHLKDWHSQWGTAPSDQRSHYTSFGLKSAPESTNPSTLMRWVATPLLSLVPSPSGRPRMTSIPA